MKTKVKKGIGINKDKYEEKENKGGGMKEEYKEYEMRKTRKVNMKMKTRRIKKAKEKN